MSRRRGGFALATLLLILAATCARAESPTPFRAVDVIVDSGRNSLAAWQVEVNLAAGSLLVGVEGGVRPWREPAHHDPKALQSRRVVLAAFSTASADSLPGGRVRVARLHLRVDERLDHDARVRAAADSDGRRINARVSLVPVEN